MRKMILTAVLTAATAIAGGLAPSAAQECPAEAITLVVPFTSGTTSDVVARAMVDHLSKTVGAPIIIDNRGGAGRNIGAGMVAKAKPVVRDAGADVDAAAGGNQAAPNPSTTIDPLASLAS